MGAANWFLWGLCVLRRGEEHASGACTIYGDRPLIRETYPLSVASLGGDADGTDAEGGLGTTEPMGGVVTQEGMVRAQECEGLERGTSRSEAEDPAETLKERAVRELEEAIGVWDNCEPVDADGEVVHDSEGQKRSDGAPIDPR